MSRGLGDVYKRQHNYMVHMLMVNRYILDRVELSPDEVSGAQDYDLSL